MLKRLNSFTPSIAIAIEQWDRVKMISIG